jgi:hypothetical protein
MQTVRDGTFAGTPTTEDESRHLRIPKHRFAALLKPPDHWRACRPRARPTCRSALSGGAQTAEFGAHDLHLFANVGVVRNG